MAGFDNRYIERVAEQIKYTQNRFKYPGLNEVCKRRKALKTLGRIVIGTTGAALILPGIGCKSPFSEDSEKEKEDPEKDPVIYEEKKGIKIMMDACKDNNLIASDQIPPESEMKFYIPYNGKMVKFEPDIVIEMFGNSYHAFGEYLSSTDGFTSEQDDASDYFNAVMVNAGNKGKGAIIKVLADQKASKTFQDTVTKLRSHYLID